MWHELEVPLPLHLGARFHELVIAVRLEDPAPLELLLVWRVPALVGSARRRCSILEVGAFGWLLGGCKWVLGLWSVYGGIFIDGVLLCTMMCGLFLFVESLGPVWGAVDLYSNSI